MQCSTKRREATNRSRVIKSIEGLRNPYSLYIQFNVISEKGDVILYNSTPLSLPLKPRNEKENVWDCDQILVEKFLAKRKDKEKM